MCISLAGCDREGKGTEGTQYCKYEDNRAYFYNYNNDGSNSNIRMGNQCKLSQWANMPHTAKQRLAKTLQVELKR